MKYKLICFDMDGVIFEERNFWVELHKRFGTFEEGKRATEKHLYKDYDKLVQEVVVKLWKGKDAKPYYDLIGSYKYLPGVKETFEAIKKKEIPIAIISASSIDLVKRVQKDFGVDFIFGNQLVIKDNKVTGEFVWPIGAGKEKKAKIILDLCSKLNISTKECVYIGDSREDIEAFKEVGLAIAFNSESEELNKVATYVVNSKKLSDVLEFIP